MSSVRPLVYLHTYIYVVETRVLHVFTITLLANHFAIDTMRVPLATTLILFTGHALAHGGVQNYTIDSLTYPG